MRRSVNRVGYTIWRAADTLPAMNGQNRSLPTIHTALSKRFKLSSLVAAKNSRPLQSVRFFQHWTATRFERTFGLRLPPWGSTLKLAMAG